MQSMDLPPPPAARRRIWYGDLFPRQDFDPPPFAWEQPPPPLLQPLPPPIIIPAHRPPPPPQIILEARYPLSPRLNCSTPRYVLGGSHLYEAGHPRQVSYLLPDRLQPPPPVPPPRESERLRVFNEGFNPRTLSREDFSIRHQYQRDFDGRRGVPVNDRRPDLYVERHLDESRCRRVFGLDPDLHYERECMYERTYNDKRRISDYDLNRGLFIERHFDDERCRSVRILGPEFYDDGKRSWESSTIGQGRDLYNQSEGADQRWPAGVHDQRCPSYNGRGHGQLKFDGGLHQEIHVHNYLDSGTSERGLNGQDCSSYNERDYHDRRWNHGLSGRNGLSNMDFNDQKWGYGHKPDRYSKGALSYDRTKEINRRSSKRQRLNSLEALRGSQNRKYCSKDIEGAALRQKGKDEHECISKKESEHGCLGHAASFRSAIDEFRLSHPDLKCGFYLMNDKEKIVHTMTRLSSTIARMEENVRPSPTRIAVLQSDFLETSPDIVEQTAMSENVNVASVTYLGEVPNINDLNFAGVISKKVRNELFSENNPLCKNGHLVHANSNESTDDQSADQGLNLKRRRISEDSECAVSNGARVLADNFAHEEGLLNTAKDTVDSSELKVDEVGCRDFRIFSENDALCKNGYLVHSNFSESADDQSAELGLNLKRRRISETSDHVSNGSLVIAEKLFHDERLLNTAENTDDASELKIDEVGCLVHRDCSANQNTGYAVNQGAIISAEKNASEVMGKEGDTINGSTSQNELVPADNFIVDGPPRIVVSLDDHDNSGFSSCNGYKSSVVLSGVKQTSPSSVAFRPLLQKPENAVASEVGFSRSADVLHSIENSSKIDEEKMISSGDECLLEGCAELTLSALPEIHASEEAKETSHDTDCTSDEKTTSVDPCEVPLASLEIAASDHFQISCPPEESEKAEKKAYESGKVSSCEKSSTLSVPQFVPHHRSLKYSYTGKYNSAGAMKPRAWHRCCNSSDADMKPKLQPSSFSVAQQVTPNIQSGYLRKGFSLVRKPLLSGDAPSAVHGPVSKLTSSTHSTKNMQPSSSKIDNSDASVISSGKLKNSLEALTHSANVMNCLSDDIHSDFKYALEEENSRKEMIYMKRKRYQLVAAPTSARKSLLGLDKGKASLSDSYFKSKKNQLVRKSSENHAKKKGAPTSSTKGLARATPSTPSSRRVIALSKAMKYSKRSLVWKLHDKQSPDKRKRVAATQRMLAQFLPWKKSTFWRSYKLALGMTGNSGTVPTTSKKSLLSRKRGTAYIRSSHGYSLWMSRVQSTVKSRSLKWLKPTERSSSSASEQDASTSTAANESCKDDNSAETSTSSNVVPRPSEAGEGIFHIGSERYKKDPARRTLQRITAEPEPSQKNIKVSFVPRRMILGYEKYVRIGKGNQLVRDPKKRTRVLASEKVRWSVHTARLCLARRRKYCQFFTRFGKCNKDDGKCPYIHDSSKIVVCTKFLTGFCSNPDCKLTHEVIPERMQDCSYFLKGSCSNENCPYRHVHVNPSSSICESFLRGYCADGNECPKKHTYVCPAFEATGTCPRASTCRLHHPKKKPEKPAPSDANVARGRYFNGGLLAASAADSLPAVEKGKAEVTFFDGKFPDYISLDVNDDGMERASPQAQAAAPCEPTADLVHD